MRHVCIHGMNKGVFGMKSNNELTKILLIEDSDTDAYIVQKAVQRLGRAVACVRVSTLAAGEEELRKQDTDLLLLDLGLPDTDSPEDTYRKIRPWADVLPVVVMTNLKDHDLARVMVQEGAADFLTKDLIAKDPAQMKRAIDFSLERHGLHKKAVQESKDKDALLNYFMGGYSSPPEH
jgi:DNA-binding response OmpR family regulator